jgi:hypothetical protein
MANRPTLLNSCARAATAAETKFRIDGGPRIPRSIRVVALDSAAAAAVRPLAGEPSPSTRFLTYDPAAAQLPDQSADLVLGTGEGGTARLRDELADADFCLMVATGNEGVAAVATIGRACAVRGIMTAGVMIGDGGKAVAALRPHARVLLVTSDAQDVAELIAVVGGPGGQP